jgi:hypothetical protein
VSSSPYVFIRSGGSFLIWFSIHIPSSIVDQPGKNIIDMIIIETKLNFMLGFLENNWLKTP